MTSKLHRCHVGPVVHLYEGDSLSVMRGMDDEFYDSIVTDPPYGIDFMGKGWDSEVPPRLYWREAMRVCKPGAHMVAFGGTRTYHNLVSAIQSAGWEIRDVLAWFHATGFPKSHDPAKEIDKRLAGVWRGKSDKVVSHSQSMSSHNYERVEKGDPVHPLAQLWDGWGTALKPAWEPIVLARKPLDGTLAANLLEYRTGGINVDSARIEERWPPNVVLDPYSAGLLDGRMAKDWSHRFYFVAKPTRAEREQGLSGGPALGRDATRNVEQASMNGGAGNPYNRGAKKVLNHHPTVKPVRLMRWLATLITPPHGRILDPFVGSGSTPIATSRNWFSCDGIDKNLSYLRMAEKRVLHEKDKTGVRVFVHPIQED